MSFIEMILIAVGLSMDTFAITICIGLGLAKFSVKKALTAGLYFSAAHIVMLTVGYFAATWFAPAVALYSDIIVFCILAVLGGKMIWGSFKEERCKNKICLADACSRRKCLNTEESHDFSHIKMLSLAIATSVDAMAIGVSFALRKVDIVPAALILAVVTLAISMVGVRIGGVVGERFKDRATMVGGIILILIGIWGVIG